MSTMMRRRTPFRRFIRRQRRRTIWNGLTAIGGTISGNQALSGTIDQELDTDEKAGAVIVRIIGNLQLAPSSSTTTGQVFCAIYLATNEEDRASTFPNPALPGDGDQAFMWWYNAQVIDLARDTGWAQLSFMNVPIDIRIKRKYRTDDMVLKFLISTPAAGNAGTITYGIAGRFLVTLH